MGEQPIFTIQAHVFEIDPSTKKNWLPSSTQAVNVCFFYDRPRSMYRIVSVENQKAIINSIMTPNMIFNKTSQKFGQWSDARANTVYGLGFASEADLNKFLDKFNEVRDLLRSQQSAQLNGETTATTAPVTSHNRSASLLSSPAAKDTTVTTTIQSSSLSPATTGKTTDSQIRYENDRLKIALAQSSANAKKWEAEMQTLRNNNAKLTAALQESNSNVQEWKRQLASLKEENEKLKQSNKADMKQPGIEELQRRANQLDDTLARLKDTEAENQRLKDALKGSEANVASVNESMKHLKLRAERLESASIEQQNKTSDIIDTIGARLGELNGLHRQLSLTVKSQKI